MRDFNIQSTNFEGVFVLKLKKKKDFRGSLTRYFNFYEISKILKGKKILHINLSENKKKGTMRGFHYQTRPLQEIKLLKCISGSIYDVIIDLRKKSKTYLKLFKIKLSEHDQKILIIPENFAHGYQTLEKNTKLLYFHTQVYSKKYERTINLLDKKLSINWPIKKKIISLKDKKGTILK